MRFAHIPLGRGWATLCWEQAAGGFTRAGVSFCSPKDQFSRPKGRLIAEGRMRKRARFIKVDPRNKGIVGIILQHASAAPSWSAGLLARI